MRYLVDPGDLSQESARLSVEALFACLGVKVEKENKTARVRWLIRAGRASEAYEFDDGGKGVAVISYCGCEDCRPGAFGLNLVEERAGANPFASETYFMKKWPGRPAGPRAWSHRLGRRSFYWPSREAFELEILIDDIRASRLSAAQLVAIAAEVRS